MNDTNTPIRYLRSDEHGDPWDRTPNRARLLDLGRWLTQQERKRRLGLDSEWDQGVWIRAQSGLMIQGQFAAWSCGTSCCAAGHVALEGGGRPAFYNEGNWYAEPLRDVNGQPKLWDLSDANMIFGNAVAGIDEFAAMTLGLNPDQRDMLFDGDNDWPAMMGHLASILDMPESEVVTLVGGNELPDDPDDDDSDYCDCGCNDDFDDEDDS